MTVEQVRAAIAGRDPETLIGPLLHLLTRRATDGRRSVSDALLADQLALLAMHPCVDPLLRVAAGGLAIEHRG